MNKKTDAELLAEHERLDGEWRTSLDRLVAIHAAERALLAGQLTKAEIQQLRKLDSDAHQILERWLQLVNQQGQIEVDLFSHRKV